MTGSGAGPNPSETVRCERCGGAMEPGSRAERFCSRSCRSAGIWADRKTTPRTCGWCGRVFDSKHPFARACSPACKAHILWDRKTVPATCQRCGVLFKPSKFGKGIFCSRRCRGLSLVRPIPKGRAMTEKICEYCSRPFEIQSRYLRRRRFCSRACATRVNAPKRRVPGTEVRQRLARTMCRILRHQLTRSHTPKSRSFTELLGYSPRDLKARLEAQFVEGMTWDNWGRHGWHIDHIRPISRFPVDTPPSVINALANLRPLWEHDNCSRGNRWNGD